MDKLLACKICMNQVENCHKVNILFDCLGRKGNPYLILICNLEKDRTNMETLSGLIQRKV